MKVSYIAHLSGKVQGVYFRASSQQMAIELGLSGYARNLADGGVEVMVSGDKNNVNKILEWLTHGPSEAEVDKIELKQVELQEYSFCSIG